MARDWSLVVFTVIGQAAVGLFLVVGGVLYFSDDVPRTIAGRDIRLALVLSVMILLLAGLALSLFHLHHPLRAFRAINNLRSSWLSREIFFELLFLALLAALAVGEFAGRGEGPRFRWLFVPAGLAGFLFLTSMARIYTLPAVPVWDRASTSASFFLTAFITGTLGAALVFKGAGGTGRLWRAPAIAAVVLLTAGVVWAVLFSPRYGLLDDGGEGPSLKPPGTRSVALHVSRLILHVLGAVLAASALFLPALLAALGGETIGRFLFYGLRGQSGRAGGARL